MVFKHNMNENQLEEANKIVKEIIGEKGIPIPQMKKVPPINNLIELLNFLNKEYDVWSKTLSETQQNILKKAISNVTSFSNINQYKGNLRSLLNQIYQLSNDKKIVYSQSAIGKYIRKLSPNEAKGFLSFITKEPLGNYLTYSNNNIPPEAISGVFFGILYEKGFVKKREVQAILDSPNFVLDEFQEEYENKINELNKKNREVTEKSEELQKYIEHIRRTGNGHIQYLNKEWNKEVQELIEKKNARLKALEDQYSEKLRLEGPTKYWNELSSKYRLRGKLWFTLAIILALIGSSVIGLLIYNLDFATDSLTNSIQKYLLIAVAISITFYLLNQSIKIALSQLHLSMDYQEREQLTMVYLALLGEETEAMNSNEKEIILQSIFSRSDSGLMKGDAGPTLPNNTMNQILNKLNK